MTIRINQTSVDFSLESERTLADLSAAIHSWAESQGLAVLSLLADGKAILEGASLLLDDVKQIEVETVALAEHEAARATVIADYFGLLAEACQTGNEALVGELQPEFSSVQKALFPLLAGFRGRLEAPLLALELSWSNLVSTRLAALEVGDAAAARAFELRSPGAALAQSLSALEECLLPLDNLGLLFQRGKDREAFDSILRLFTLLEDIGRRIGLASPALDDDPAVWGGFQDELQPFLLETQAALGSKDYILLTDLLEYEVMPRLKKLNELFPSISKLDPVPDLL